MITGKQVKAARRLLGWSQIELAFEANVDPSTIVKFEGGKKGTAVLSARNGRRVKRVRTVVAEAA
jgi:transcriptional regulator with XRE-family HTH domain